MADRKDTKEVELRSEELQEIIGKVPSWLTRWGITIIFIVVIAALFLSVFIKIPEVISSRLVFTTKTPVMDVVSRKYGNVFLLSNDGDIVKPGQIIGGITTFEKFSDVLKLDSFIEWSESKLLADGKLPYDESYNQFNSKHIGRLSPYFVNLIGKCRSLDFFYKNNSIKNQINLVEEQIALQDKIGQSLKQEYVTLNGQYKVELENYKMDSSLFSDSKVLSKRDFNSANQKLGTFLLPIQSNINEQNINAKEIATLRFKISDLKKTNSEAERTLLQDLLESIKVLKNEINSWKELYLFISPTEGKVNFSNIWSPNQNISEGLVIAKIVPISDSIFCKALIPVSHSGKLLAGLDVNIKTDNYPYQDYGLLKGKIRSVSLVPTDGFYNADIVLLNGMTTSYNRTLKFKNQMQGLGEIVVERYSIIGRIFNKFRSALKN